MLSVPLEACAIINEIENANVNFDLLSSIAVGNHIVIKAMKIFNEPKRQSSPQSMVNKSAMALKTSVSLNLISSFLTPFLRKDSEAA